MRNKSILLMLALLLITPLVAVALPELRFLGPWLLLGGFSLTVVIAVVSTFRRHRLGPFALWSEPSRYLAMKFTDREIYMLKLSSCVAVGGLLVVATNLL
jgi:hypothetical protein